jgi:nitrogen regulatory protein PII
MKLFVFVLNNEEFLEEVIQAYIEAGVTGATILDSEGMGRFLAYEIPLFSGFKEFMKGNKPYNKTILSVVSSQKVIDNVKKLVETIIGPLDAPGSGIMFSLDIDWAAGLLQDEKEDV